MQDRAEHSERLERVLGGENALGDAVRAARKRRRLTQTGLAKLAGISRRHVAGIESGANPTMAVLLAIVNVMPEMPYRFGDFVLQHVSASAT
jgi:transcriptional regulator with XRE-family HTH domain